MSDVTDWISAGANVAAAVGTVGALWVGAVTLRRQVNDQHRAQARAVTVGTEEEFRPLQSSRLRCFMTNNSSLPIYAVEFHLWLGKEPEGSGYADVLAPGKSVDFYTKLGQERRILSEFTDSAGYRWSRSGTGRLVEYPTTRRQLRQFRRYLWWRKLRDPAWPQKLSEPSDELAQK